LGRLRALAFDKTGTITVGRPEVTDVVPADGVTSEALLALAAAVERRSTHPLARAIVAHAGAAGVAVAEATGIETVAGIGVRGVLAGDAVWAGNRALLERIGAALPDVLARRADELEASGRTAPARTPRRRSPACARSGSARSRS